MLSVEVPLNTMLADLDETLRGMLKSELERHGFEGIEIAFDAPTREWSGQLSAPAVNLFLYDMRESEEDRPSGWTKQRVGDEFVEGPPPLVMEISYAITAWAQAVEDEHRLLSQVLSVLYAYPHLPQDVLNGRLRNGSQTLSIKTKIGQAKGDKADFWTAVGGQYKASLDYVVRLSVESGVRRKVPQVRTQTVRTRLLDAPPRAVVEMHRTGGTVAGADGEPLADVWIALPDSGQMTSTDAGGRFRFDRLAPGRHRLLARSPDGRETAADLDVPGAMLDLVLDGGKAAAGTRKSGKRG
jgi:Pvc16 N-terminal domain/Carboxypeptidase regulatory-like domain